MTVGRREALRIGGLLILASGMSWAGETTSGHPRSEACDQAAERRFGRLPVRPAAGIKPPKQTRRVTPEYPRLPDGTLGSGTWVGEALIDPDGNVRSVSVVKDVKLVPPFPPFNRAILNAVRQWTYTPTTVRGTPVPVCLIVVVNIHWQGTTTAREEPPPPAP